MQVCHILPKPHLKLNQGKTLHMCLGNICMKDKEYLDFYRYQVDELGHRIILDNGAAEKETLNDETMISLIRHFKKQYLITPVLKDVLKDKKASFVSSEKSWNNYREAREFEVSNFMYVLQGETLSELIDSFLLWQSKYGTSRFIFGIPKWTTKYIAKDARILLLQMLDEIAPNPIKVHLLGCHKNLDEFIEISKMNFDCIEVVSGDSAGLFINLKYKEEEGADIIRRTGTDIDFLKDSVDETELIRRMIKYDKEVM